jgi:hypothetical protein
VHKKVAIYEMDVRKACRSPITKIPTNNLKVNNTKHKYKEKNKNVTPNPKIRSNNGVNGEVTRTHEIHVPARENHTPACGYQAKAQKAATGEERPMTKVVRHVGGSI